MSKFEINIENRTLKIDLGDIIQEMDPEELELMAQLYAWKSKAWQKIIEALRTDYSTQTYNSDLFDVRRAFFSMGVEEDQTQAIARMQHTMLCIVEEQTRLAVENRRLREGYERISGYLRNFNNGISDKVNEIYHEAVFGKSFAHEEAKKILPEDIKAQINARVKEWFEVMCDLFKSEDQ